MIQRFLSTLASASLVAGVAAAGVVTVATPAAAVEPATNPTLQGCGIPVTLVLDASSSINEDDQPKVRAAANAFLDGLDNTNSTSRVLQFSGTSANITFPRRPISSLPPNPSNLALTKADIQTKYHNEQGYTYPGTNWESALWFANQPVNEIQNGLVVFITDGDPTRVGTTTSTSAAPGPATDAAIPRANALKALGNRVLAVGVALGSDPDSKERLKKVSGPTLVNSVPANSTINDFDVLISETFAGLEQSLKNIATSLCRGAITIQKLTDSGLNGTYVPTSGWNIGAEVVGATNPEDFTWTTPVNNTDESVSGTTAVAPTLPTDPAEGTVQFQYKPNATWITKDPTLRISETLQPDYNPRVSFGYRCEFPGSTRTPVEGDLTVANGKAQFDVPNVTSDQRLSCQIYNKHTTSTLRLRKTVVGGGTTAEQWIMTATGPANAPSYSKPGNHQPFETVWSGVEYQLGETAPAGEQDNYVSGDWTCDQEIEVTGINKDRITIPAGTTEVTCSVTNTRKGELVVKKLTNPTGATQEFTFKPTGWNNNQNFPLTNGQEKSSGKIAPGQYSVEEMVPAGWSLTNLQCEGSAVDRVGNKANVTVSAGTRVTCTFTNSKQTANLRLQKEVLGGGSGTKADWLLSADAAAPFDGKDIDKVPGNNVAWAEVYSGVTYKLTESAGPANYTPGDVWVCVTDEDDAAEVVNPGDEVSLAPGEFKTCTITNSRNLAQLKLVKQVAGGKAQADEFILTAKADAAEKQDRNISTPGGSGAFEDVYAGTQYTLGETGPGGYSPSDWACVSTPGEGEASVQVLNTGDKITLSKGDRVTCTIINSRDLGSLTITKSFNPKSSGYDKAFTIGYQCGDEAKQTVALKAGESTTITGIPTGTECVVSEAKPTDPPAGWSFSQPVYDPADGKVTVTRKDQNVSVTVTNEILKPGINIVKTGSATQVNPGQTVTYTYTVTNPGDAELTDVKVSDDKCAPVTYTSGDTNADSKLQPGETWIYTCSQPITLATTNIGTATGKDKNGQEVSAQDTFTVAVVSPVVVKQICPIEPKLTTPKVKKVGNRVLVKKITTKKSSCVLLKPVVLCRPVAASAAGQTAFCRTTVTRKGFIRVNTKGYDKVRVTVLVRSKPKPDFTDRWKPSTWRQTWLLK